MKKTQVLESVCLRRTCVVPTLVTPLAWQTLAQCATLTEVAQLLRMMGCKLRSRWHTNWVRQKSCVFMNKYDL